jgi:hypothetical protein
MNTNRTQRSEESVIIVPGGTDSCWPRMGALQSLDASPAYRLKCLRRGTVFAKLQVLAGSTAIV